MKPRPVLVVDDSEDDIELMIEALRSCNFANEIITKRDGVEALEYLLPLSPADLPQVVVLDLKMPRLSGLDVLKRLRAHEPTRLLPVVVLTSSDHEEDVINSLNFGANAYARKPVDFARFTDAVVKLGCFWVLINEAPMDSL